MEEITLDIYLNIYLLIHLKSVKLMLYNNN